MYTPQMGNFRNTLALNCDKAKKASEILINTLKMRGPLSAQTLQRTHAKAIVFVELAKAYFTAFHPGIGNSIAVQGAFLFPFRQRHGPGPRPRLTMWQTSLERSTVTKLTPIKTHL